MHRIFGLRSARIFMAGAVAAALGASVAHAAQTVESQRDVTTEQRTAGRSPDGLSIFPSWLFKRPEHSEFLPMTSNHDPHNQHPQQWDGQDWETANWNEQWTPEIALKKFYENRTFHRQYLGGSARINNPKVQTQIPVLEVGPTFYKLSDLDQRRALKLLADYTGVFQRGYPMIDLHDWKTRASIGQYTPKGMLLN